MPYKTRLIDLQLPKQHAPKLDRLDKALITLQLVGGASVLACGLSMIMLLGVIAQ